MKDNEREGKSLEYEGDFMGERDNGIDDELLSAMNEFESIYGGEENSHFEEPYGEEENLLFEEPYGEKENPLFEEPYGEEENPFFEEPYVAETVSATKTPVKPHNKKAGKLSAVVICIGCVLLCGVVFFAAHKLKKDASKADEKTETAEQITEIPTTETATTEEKYDGWIADARVINPVMTEKTISLPAADFSVFQVPETTEEEEEYDPWQLVTLNLEPVEGSINLTAPGEANKTTQLTSTYMVLIDVDTEEIVAERECEKVIVPASMTKILTVITARDYITEEDLDNTFVITADIVDEVQSSGLAAVGFLPDDEVTVRDLLYGTIVCSGADAAMGLAIYCCGSQEAFVDRMNENVEQLGLSDTAHFTNPVGKYDEDLHCTMTDMAIMLNVAMQDELLRDVLTTHIYHTDITYEDLDMPDGMEISNWFLRRIEDNEMNGNVMGAKTGFVNQSGFCAASYYEANNGKTYICVTGNANNVWRAIYDHVGVYRSFTQ